jgi:hypothetical protein
VYTSSVSGVFQSKNARVASKINEGKQGLLEEFKKCNSCSRHMCLVARASHSPHRKKVATEIIETFKKTGGMGCGLGHSQPCTFQARLVELLEELDTDCEFTLLFDNDHNN